MKHGGDLGSALARFGGLASEWMDLSTGINPHAYPLPDTLPAEAWTRLPAQDALTRLIAAARAAYAVPGDLDLVAAPGTQAILAHLPHVMPDGGVAVVGPTYGSHAEIWRRAGRVVHDLTSPYADLPDDVRLLVIVNPNNPDGRLVDAQSLRHHAEQLAARGGWLIVDEAFADCVPGASVLPHLNGLPVIVLRSFGKFFGLAGLRLGFAVAPRALAERLTVALESWAVPGPALEIGARALEDTAWQDAMRARLADEAADLTLMLQMQGLSVFGGTPLFVLAGTRDAAALHRALARQHVWTRVFDYAPTWLRIGLPDGQAGRARLEAALAAAIAEP
ncbi:threonine-phosphate decarboxylase CobD [Stappia sp.]|uniref:threonine-phosphate decarboxylase CobD n=1 Tax=Stappia sp. TaxID=1870903 RepID=UPI0032D9923F